MADHTHENGHFKEITAREGREILNRETCLHLGMSADEFIELWRAGKLRDREEEPEVARLAMMIPLAV